MKITKEEIKEIAEIMKFEINEEDIKAIEETVVSVGSSIEKLFEEETDGEKMFVATNNKNQFNNNFEKEVEVEDIFKALNNFDGEFIRLEKGLKDEE